MMRMAFLCIFTIFVPAFSQQEMPTKEEVHKQFINLFSSDGPEAARAFIDRHLSHSKDQKSLYYIGWSEFSSGNFDAALLIVSYLEMQASKEDLLAATYYLKGQIFIHDGDPDTDPLESFELGLKMYQAIGHFSGVYRSHLGLASAAHAEDELERANGYLLLAFRAAVKHELSLAAYHSVAYRVQLSEGDYEKALKHLFEELKIHEENEDTFYVHHVYICLATVYLVQGEISEAKRFNEAAVDYFSVHRDEVRMLHAQLNRYFVQDCFSESFNEEAIKEYFPKYLRTIYDFLKEKICN